MSVKDVRVDMYGNLGITIAVILFGLAVPKLLFSSLLFLSVASPVIYLGMLGWKLAKREHLDDEFVKVGVLIFLLAFMLIGLAVA